MRRSVRSTITPSISTTSERVVLVAPPMFSVAVTWPVCERIWEYIQADGFPLEILVNLVHYTESLTFHRLATPGDRLTVKGRIAAITPHRAGTLIVLRLQAIDKRGDPVFTEHIGGLLRGAQMPRRGEDC